MKLIGLAAFGLVLGVVAACELASPATDLPAAQAQSAPLVPLEAPGRTRCMLSRRAIIASAILRPVVDVLVSPGDRVTKGQVLIKLYDLEPQAKVRARQQQLQSIEAKARYSRRNLELAEGSRRTGSLPETSYNDIRATALSNEAQARAAEAELALAESELKLYTLTASIDGEIAWLDVSPGTVTWPGTLIWGEIMDLRELDVRCELSPLLAERVVVGQSASVSLDGSAATAATGKVVFIGKAADRNSGLVPVVVRVVNSHERLRADVAVKVHFQTEIGH
jgi:RND family efflux transporter MFP subunit